MPEEMPIHPFTGQRALGVLPSGRIVWPILGASDDDGDGDGSDDDAQDGTGAGDSGTGDGGQDGDALGDKGREALAKERQARRDAEKARKAAERELADLKAKAAAGTQQDDAQKAADDARREAEAAVLAKANARVLSAKVEALAAGKLADPKDAARYLDLSEFEVGDDFSTDDDAISEAISGLLKRKPYLAAKAQGFQGGDGDGPGRNGSTGPKQVSAAELKTMSAPEIVKARKEGRLTRLMGGE
jgi:hypothetical protein